MAVKQNLLQRLLHPLVQKALYDLHPELLQREPMLRINSDDEQRNSNGQVTRNANYYNTSIWVNTAIRKLADNIGPLPVRVVEGDDSDKKPVPAHELNKLLANPNPKQGGAELWKQWVTDMLVGGECGFECVNAKNGAPLELWARSGDVITIRTPSQRAIRYLQVLNYRIDDGLDNPYDLKPEEMIFFKFYNPLSPYRGLSPMSAIKYSILIDQLAQAWSYLFQANKGRPDYAVVAPNGITPSERSEIERRLDGYGMGGDRANKAIVLEQGVTDIKTFSFAPKDLEYAVQREFSRDEIGAVYGVPDEIMGYGKDTYENFQTAKQVLWNLTIVPLCGLRDGALTRFYQQIGRLKPTQFIATDYSKVSEMQEDKTTKIAQTKVLFDMGVPVNTASEYLGLGLPPIPGGDVGYLNAGLLEVGSPRPVPVTPVQPAKSMTKSFKEYGSPEHAEVYKRLQSRLDPHVTEMQRLVKKEFQRQQNEVNAKLREGKTFGHGLYKAGEIPVPSSLFDQEAERAKFIKAFRNSVVAMVEAIGADTLRSLGGANALDTNRPGIKSAIAHILEVVAEKTNETTWLGLVELFQEAEDAGEGIPAIQERLSTFFGDRKSDYQTERIARTTMNGAANSGSLEAAKQAGEDIGVKYNKVWISALQPGRTRDAHWEAHGQSVGLDEMFEVGGEQLMEPGDPNGSAGNVVNCLCTLVYEEQQ
jgi:HK97 family phage portal protein